MAYHRAAVTCSIAALQYCSIAVSQHCSIAVLQHCSIAASQYRSIAALHQTWPVSRNPPHPEGAHESSAQRIPGERRSLVMPADSQAGLQTMILHAILPAVARLGAAATESGPLQTTIRPAGKDWSIMIVAVRIVMSNPMIDHHHPGTRTAMFTCQKMTQTPRGRRPSCRQDQL